jgi:secreted PhoX family phosphatase
MDFHLLPDAGATYADERAGNEGGWIYVSNSEIWEKTQQGGVGAVTFDKNGNVIDYRMVLTKTTTNCGGGRTPWGAWISCEEVPNIGQNWQVDPTGVRQSSVPITLGIDGGQFESFAYDVRNLDVPRKTV